ncbi:hypothetical protein A4X06_0g4253 [Tilletia controversa]|uniref:Ubiquinol-cytochrome C reductase hinge domain-containing protein n=1 Tax=Tilletia controversa TaxID=13291 RepID=A0A8X7SWV0_9BASI|nr:hypothetical protein A4X06_0g4253 [Tilletia controversa]
MTADAATTSTSPAMPEQHQTQAQDSSSVLTNVSSFFSSFLPTARADDGEDEPKEEGDGETETETEEGGEEPAEEEEEEEEQPAIYEACESSSKCKSAKSHFDHCQERVSEGKGFHGEDCIEEFPPRPLRIRMHRA